MACLNITRSGLSPAIHHRFGLRNRRFKSPPAAVIRCRVEEGNRSSNGEEPPESQFMKELKRRGMTPTSILDEGKRGVYELREKEMMEEEIMEEERIGENKKKRNGVVAAEFDKGVLDQRNRSMALNSEGLEGLIPRAKLLLTIGASFFLGFGPLILITISLFAALYLHFGSSFVHDASKMSISPPPYVDPYALLEDERISQIAPRLNQN